MEMSKYWLPDPKTWKGTWRDDRRIMGQEGYLKNKRLQHRKFNRLLYFEDFGQCGFCYDDFRENTSGPPMAYYEPITKHWICECCYNDFKDHFEWNVEEVKI